MPTLRITRISTLGIVSGSNSRSFFVVAETTAKTPTAPLSNPRIAPSFIYRRFFTSLSPIRNPRDQMSAVSSEPAPRIDHARRAESGPGGAEITGDFDPSMLKGRAAAPAGQTRRTSKVKEGTDDESARWKDTLEKVIKSVGRELTWAS